MRYSSKIRIIRVEYNRDPLYESLYNDYKKKISNFLSIEIVTVKGSKKADTKTTKKRDTEELKNRLGSRSFRVLLDRYGKQVNEKSFARILLSSLENSKDIEFLIGGPFGLDETMKGEVDRTISLTDFTLSHRLSCLFLLEQIYRCLSIEAGVPYAH